MTITVAFVTVAESLAGLQVNGVNVRGLNQIPEDALNIVPAFFPRPEEFITDITFVPQSFGSDSVQKMDLSYTLHYRYLHAAIGSGGGLLAVYGGVITNLAKIVKAIAGNSTPDGSVDLRLSNISAIGPTEDPAGNNFHGVDISLRVLEYIQ